MSGWVGGGETLYCLLAVLPSELKPLQAGLSTELKAVDFKVKFQLIYLFKLESSNL